ncbi:class I SAM-dependent RNA methyltransferase [Treponema sp.]|uniref:THUMP domain-containing class I SAM-dependent RNA methyltransferase n=1 Tax=Treponema sp. TaxID=166 RepID=UPI0025EA318B|nr:class I SAM-dependent RNA methyltransferase [Treponema sp.]MCR5217805.1 class I SAM-dependent RNA methyltransferase [Treponema sp.]
MNTFVALCAVGAEKILGNELKHLGFHLVQGNTPGRVTFTGNDDALYLSNYSLRTSDRVYLQMAKYEAADFDSLFDGCYRINWQDYFKKDVHVIVDKVRIYKSKLNSEHSIQGMIQKAIYKKLGSIWHMTTLPESGSECDVRVYLENNTATILLDTSGEALHKRGYRTDGGIAPLRETTAAVMIQEMMWRRKTALHDPFCGSGTIAIEANLYAHNIAPGLGRHFAYENLAIYNQQKAVDIKKALAEQIRTDVECRITGSDIDPVAVERAKLNAEHSCVAAGRALQMIGSDAKIERPEFIVSDFADLEAPYESGLLLCNPPYGERIGDIQEAEMLYTKMAGLFNDFAGWNMGIITSQKTFEQCIGKRAESKKTLKAGNLDTILYKY